MRCEKVGRILDFVCLELPFKFPKQSPHNDVSPKEKAPARKCRGFTFFGSSTWARWEASRILTLRL